MKLVFSEEESKAMREMSRKLRGMEIVHFTAILSAIAESFGKHMDEGESVDSEHSPAINAILKSTTLLLCGLMPLIYTYEGDIQKMMAGALRMSEEIAEASCDVAKRTLFNGGGGDAG